MRIPLVSFIISICLPLCCCCVSKIKWTVPNDLSNIYLFFSTRRICSVSVLIDNFIRRVVVAPYQFACIDSCRHSQNVYVSPPWMNIEKKRTSIPFVCVGDTYGLRSYDMESGRRILNGMKCMRYCLFAVCFQQFAIGFRFANLQQPIESKWTWSTLIITIFVIQLSEYQKYCFKPTNFILYQIAHYSFHAEPITLCVIWWYHQQSCNSC